MAEWTFKRDTAFRKQFFVPDSFAHPAKMDAQLLIKIVGDYTEIGDVILDPMAGSGTLMLACQMGRHCVLVELEEKFCKMCRDNWEIVRMHPQLGYEMGKCQIIQADARNIYPMSITLGDKVIGLADKIITSPPYAEQLQRWGNSETETMRQKGLHQENKQGIGALPYGQVSKIITSPPYEGSLSGDADSKGWEKLAQDPTSNRYGRKSHPSVGQAYSAITSDNIGNLKSDTYLEAMLQVYQQCFKVLKDGGLMILVTKNFIRNKQVIRLDTDTIKLCEEAGFSYLHRHYRKLPSQSFWRILYHKKHPEVEQILYEDVLVLKKC